MFLLFVILVIVFSIPGVQTFIASKVTNSINEKNKVDISIGRIGFSYNGRINVDDILIRDHHNDTLIYAQEVQTSVLSLSSLMDVTPLLGTTVVENLQMDMRVYEGEKKDNLSVFSEKFKPKQRKKESVPFELNAGEVEIINSQFTYIDENAEYPEIVGVDDLNIVGNDLWINGSDVSLEIQNMSGLERRGLSVDFLKADFTYTTSALELRNLELNTPESKVVGDIHLNTEEGYGDFVNKVVITANFEEAAVSTNDLQAFYSEFGDDQLLNFSTVFQGPLNNFRLDDLVFNGMDRSVIIGDIIVQKIFAKEDEVFSIQGDLRDLSTNYYDLVNLLPNLLRDKLPEEVQEFGNVTFQGYAVVTNSSVDADVHILSQLGEAEVTMMIGNFDQAEEVTYLGDIEAYNFNLGKLLDKEYLGKTTFDLRIDGKGFTSESLDTEIRGGISRFGLYGYNYKNLKVIGTLKSPVFNGNLISRDPNLEMEFNGLVNFSEDINVYDFEASVGYADLAALNFVSRDSVSVFKGDIIMNMTGTNLNNAAGNILLLNTSYANLHDRYSFDDLRVTSSFEGPVRTIEVNSPDVISGTVEGVFDITEVGALFENALGSLYSNYQPNKLTNNQYLEFNFDIYNKIVEVFFPELTLAPNSFIRGRVESDESDFRLTFRSPEIKAYDNLLQNVNLQVDNTNPLFNTYVEVDSVATKFYSLSDFNLINVTLNDTLYIRSEFRGGVNNNDVFNLNLFHTINEQNNSVVGIQKSDITFKESTWYLNEFNNRSNRLIFSKGMQNIQLDSLVLSHQDERIRLTGEVMDSTYKNLKVQFQDVDLGKITPDIDSLDMGGIVNGNLNLLQQNEAYFPNTSLTVDGLEINDTYLGNLYLDVLGNRDLSFYNINATLRNENLESLSAIGEIAVNDEVPTINLDVNLRDFDVSAFSPLGGDAIDNIRGLVSGSADITGAYKNPNFSGRLRLMDAGLRIPILNVDLSIEDNSVVDLSEQQFLFENITINDTKFGTTGVLDGFISHRNFKEWMLGLNVSSDRLLVLDTEYEEDVLYYGTAFIDGTAAIYGPTDELVIDVVASTQRGTVFKVPIQDSESIGDISYIHFLSPEEKAARLAGEEIDMPDVKGLELNFDLDVTNDALVEIDMDGSILRGRGAGTLLIEINTLGKFNMWGDFIANDGEYIFKYGTLEKRFEVLPGGSINWNGNPIQADLNISAVYEAMANPAIILENPSISRRIPVDVVINLEGELAQPNFSFDLEYPNATSAVRSELEYIIETSTNTEVQAFSLITLGQFYSDNVLSQNSGTAVAGNFASGFFNDLLSDESGVFQVGLNYEQGTRTPEQHTADRFGVTLSTQISERVLINGQVGVPVGGVTESVVVGNLEVEFLLNEEGNLRAKIFNRENDIQYIGEELGFTQGVGLTYQVDFDTFKELIHKILNEEFVRARREEETETPQESLAPDYINFPGTNDF